MMRRILPALIFSTLSTALDAATLQQGADQLINQVDPNINMGITVVDLTTGTTLYQRNATHPFIPASNMKLFSDAAAIMALGPDYRFTSQLSTDAHSIQNGTLNGSLYIYFPGDPSFNQNNLASLLSKLSYWGVQRIQGNAVLVSNNQSIDPYPPGWLTEDLHYSYGAPIAPVVLDENRLTVTINPAEQDGKAALVELSEQNDGILINNRVKTRDDGKKCGVGISMDHDNNLTLTGCIGVGQWAVQQRLPIRNPLRYAQGSVQEQLENLHITLNGQVQLGRAPANTILLGTHASKSISNLMADTLKPSDNLYADSLYLHTATKLNGAPLNWPQAQPVVQNFIQQQTGINMASARLTDGSGLSRQDQLTPHQTAQLLKFLHDHFRLAFEYISALPIAGVDGTLQKRFRSPNQQGLLRAKTGTMTGVMGLSGYLYTANAHTLAFSIFINRRPGTKPQIAWKYRPLVDSLCTYFLKQKPALIQGAQDSNTFSKLAFQQNPTAIERHKRQIARWRSLEYHIKQALKGQSVSVIYRGDELILQDSNSNVNAVWGALQSVRRQSSFGVALESNTAPNSASAQLLWVKTNKQGPRRWTIRELAAG